jgi:hypothetical protein
MYEVIFKVFRTDALSTFTQLRATWRTESLDIVALQSTGASRYHNCCIDGGTRERERGGEGDIGS